MRHHQVLQLILDKTNQILKQHALPKLKLKSNSKTNTKQLSKYAAARDARIFFCNVMKFLKANKIYAAKFKKYGLQQQIFTQVQRTIKQNIPTYKRLTYDPSKARMAPAIWRRSRKVPLRARSRPRAAHHTHRSLKRPHAPQVSRSRAAAVPVRKAKMVRHTAAHSSRAKFDPKEAKRIANGGEYYTFGRQKQQLQNIEPTTTQCYRSSYKQNEPALHQQARINVVLQSTQTVAQGFSRKKKKTVILNMANALHIGGAFEAGYGTQEESICASSNAFRALAKYGKREGPGDQNYPEGRLVYEKPLVHPPGKGPRALYTRNLQMFRTTASAKAAMQHQYQNCEPFKFDMITIAAYDLRDNNKHNDRKLFTANGTKQFDWQAYQTATAAKLRYILDLAFKQGNDAVVLGAFGCGAFAGPEPQRTETAFIKACQQVLPEYKNKFTDISFAIVELRLKVKLAKVMAELNTQPDAQADYDPTRVTAARKAARGSQPQYHVGAGAAAMAAAAKAAAALARSRVRHVDPDGVGGSGSHPRRPNHL